MGCIFHGFRRHVCGLLATLCIACINGAASAAVFNPSSSFDLANNPSQLEGGVFRYGYTPTLGGTFSLFTQTGGSGPMVWWNKSGNIPQISKNTTNTVQNLPLNGTVFTAQPFQLSLVPGLLGEYAVLRFTAPAADVYSFNAVFGAADSKPTTTDVHVLINGVASHNGGINVGGGGSTAPFSSPGVSLAAGGTIDFAVGWGDGSYLYDTTSIDVSIATVPEPAALLMLGMGSLLLLRRRRPS